jgi:hypothetical protein
MIENLQNLQCCLFGKKSPTGDPKKKKPSATSTKDFVLKTFKKFAIFLRKKRKKRKNSPDLDSESV